MPGNRIPSHLDFLRDRTDSISKMVFEEEIELAVLGRKMGLARGLIRQFLKERKGSAEARLSAAQFLRRLSDFSSALLVLNSPLEKTSRASAETRSRYNLMFARLLNARGSSRHALQVLSQLSSDELRRNLDPVLEIYNSNYHYDLALVCVGIKQAPLSPESSYSSRLRSVSIADTLFGTGKAEEALSLLEDVIGYSKEPLLMGIAFQARGAYLTLLGRVPEARCALEESLRQFPKEDTTYDRAFLDKWIGAVCALQGNILEAEKHLTRAMKILAQPGSKPEAWLEVLYWQGYLDFKQSRWRRLPQKWACLLAYPAVTEHRLAQWIERYIAVPEEISFGKRRNADFTILIRERTVEAAGKMTWELSYTHHTLGLLAISGLHGIPVLRLCDELWPNEIISVRSTLRRLEQILLRVRKELGVSILWENQHVWLAQGAKVRTSWATHPVPKGWSFLRAHREFTRADLQKYYKISTRLAQLICKEWHSQNLIQKSSTFGPSTRYFTHPWF